MSSRLDTAAQRIREIGAELAEQYAVSRDVGEVFAGAASMVEPVEAERDRYREALARIAGGTWNNDRPTGYDPSVRAYAREILRGV
jgi:hypothetical protein